MSSPRVSIIVRCYNESELIGKLLHGIDRQTISDYEIVLVDSGSTDGTLEIAEDFDVDKIEYIEPTEFSFGRALNYGVSAAEGEYCVIASAHVYPERDDWLENLLEMFDENIALVYGKQRGNSVTTFSESRIFEQWFPDHNIESQEHPFCNNANAAIRREVWEEVRYDEGLPGLEDVEWCKRVQEEGYDISYAASALVVHVHDESASEIYNRYKREGIAHKQIFPDQSFSLFNFCTLSLKNIAFDYASASRESVLFRNLLEIPKFRLLQFWGTYRGFKQEGEISEQVWQRFFYPDRTSYPNPQTSSSVESGNTIEYPDDQKSSNVESTEPRSD